MVVDDQPVVRAGFAAILDAEEDLSVVATAADGQEALDGVGAHDPDVVLMDIRMPGMDGLTATAKLTEAGQRPRVLVLTTFDLDEYVYRALRAGASGFLLKDADPAELVHAVRVVAAGEGLIAPPVTRRLIEAFVDGSLAPRTEPSPVPDALTPREAQVLRLVARGLTNSEIGTELGIATGTVKTYINGLFAKLGVRDRVQATIRAYDLGLVRPRS
ncbi:DNA-binding response regulator [Virgisporangium aliadipatigenens]|uniref:DNA-binding response regulator n=1 Tax=Virgisporangium aliadipatigenens TaxID=741659 RepID=A0A8J3YIZ0_9ACTN|nr:response regulator transcription factor [Virgisporangium aliadipatigenens]GIJ44781.1 DNA-binding response regulator [Virgisporangium aliadipatigenens]